MKTKPKKTYSSNAWFFRFIVLSFFALGLLLLLLQASTPKKITSPTPAADPTASWKTYNLNGILSFKYPPNYSTFDSSIKDSPGVDVYDKKEHLGPANLYLSINATPGGPSDYDVIYKDYKDVVRDNSTTENFPNKFKVTYRDKTGYIYQADTFYRYNNGYVRAYYRSEPGIPSEVYDQILSTFKFTK